MAYRSLVLRVALRHSPFPALVEDIAHQVFIEFVSNADSWDLGTDVRSLLSVITRNIARRCWDEEMRHRSRHVQNLAEHIRRILEEDEDDVEDTQEKVQQMRLCMESLPEKSKRLLELYYFERVSVKDLSEDLRIHSDSIYQALYRLRLKLKRCIERAIGKRGEYA